LGIISHWAGKAFVVKLSSSMRQIITFEENEVLCIWSPGLYSQHFNFFVIYLRAY
jgi:hypothetical protein